MSDTENSFCLLMTALINCVAIVRIRQLRYFYSFCPSFSSSFVLVITVFILTTDTPRSAALHTSTCSHQRLRSEALALFFQRRITLF